MKRLAVGLAVLLAAGGGRLGAQVPGEQAGQGSGQGQTAVSRPAQGAVAGQVQAVAGRQWTLEECIRYAVENNLTIRQGKLEVDRGQVGLDMARAARHPSLGANLDGSTYFGRGPTRDGTYSDDTRVSTSGSVSSSMPLFEAGRIRHTVAASKLDLEAALLQVDALAEDLSLNVATLYLDALFARELVGVAQEQTLRSEELLGRNEQLFKAGKAAQSVVSESKASVAADVYTLTQNRGNLSLALLKLAFALNLETGEGFDIASPAVSEPGSPVIGDAGDIYLQSVGTRSEILAAGKRLESLDRQYLAAKAERYPRLSLGAGYSNSYYYSFKDGAANQNFSWQVKNNGNFNVGMTLSIPIYSRGTIKGKISNASIAADAQQLRIEEAERNLRQQVEQACVAANTAYQKYLAAQASAENYRIVLENETKKAELGVSTLFDYNNAKTRYFASQSEMLQAKYDYIFRLKVVDYYLGRPITL